MINYNSKDLISIPYSRLRKLEIKQLTYQVIDVVEKYNPQELQIKPIFDLLVAQKPNIVGLKVQYAKHPLTGKLKSLRAKRSVYLTGIAYQLKKAKSEDLTDESDAVLLLDSEINRFLRKIRACKNEEERAQGISQFVDVLDTNGELATVVGEYGFLALFDDLQSVNTSIQEITVKRLHLISKRPRVKTPELRKAAIDATKNLITEIDMAQLRNPKLTYSGLINELNDLLKRYAILINKRKLRGKRKTEEKKNGEMEVAIEKLDKTVVETEQVLVPKLNVATADGILHPDEVEVSSNGILHPDVMPPINDIGLSNDFDQRLDQKKTVASSSKLLQRSIDNNKAIDMYPLLI